MAVTFNGFKLSLFYFCPLPYLFHLLGYDLVWSGVCITKFLGGSVHIIPRVSSEVCGIPHILLRIHVQYIHAMCFITGYLENIGINLWIFRGKKFLMWVFLLLYFFIFVLFPYLSFFVILSLQLGLKWWSLGLIFFVLFFIFYSLPYFVFIFSFLFLGYNSV